MNNQSLTEVVFGISRTLIYNSGFLTISDVAELRRMDPRHITASGFFKIAATHFGGSMSESLETKWAAIVVALATMGDLQSHGTLLGNALVDAGYSELRFERLIRSDEERLVDEIPALGRFLTAKSVRTDITPAAHLLLSAGRSDEESVRRRLAHDYYRYLARSTAS